MTDKARIMLSIFIGTHILLIAVATTVSLFEINALRALLNVLVLTTLTGAVTTMVTAGPVAARAGGLMARPRVAS